MASQFQLNEGAQVILALAVILAIGAGSWVFGEYNHAKSAAADAKLLTEQRLREAAKRAELQTEQRDVAAEIAACGGGMRCAQSVSAWHCLYAKVCDRASQARIIEIANEVERDDDD